MPISSSKLAAVKGCNRPIAIVATEKLTLELEEAIIKTRLQARPSSTFSSEGGKPNFRWIFRTLETAVCVEESMCSDCFGRSFCSLLECQILSVLHLDPRVFSRPALRVVCPYYRSRRLS